MSKTQQEELLLQSDIIGFPERHEKGPLGLRGQGFYAEKQSERFKAGRPDVRVARKDFGQLDFELKYVYGEVSGGTGEVDCGFTKLQVLKLYEMNEHGIPAVGLVYLHEIEMFTVTLSPVLRRPLLRPPYGFLKLPRPRVIDGVSLFNAAKELLNDRGYKHRW